jgi:hypothetical protein
MGAVSLVDYKSELMGRPHGEPKPYTGLSIWLVLLDVERPALLAARIRVKLEQEHARRLRARARIELLADFAHNASHAARRQAEQRPDVLVA